MRSIIVRLLSIAAAFALSLLVVGFFLPIHGCNPWWANVRSHLYRMEKDVEWAEIGGSPLTAGEIDAWLSGRTSSELARRMVRDPQLDPWGRPYRCVAIKNAVSVDRFGFYSAGRDGVSASGGEDADDINSWSEQQTRYYERERWGWTLLVWFGFSAAATPIVYHFAGMLCSLLAVCFGGWGKEELSS